MAHLLQPQNEPTTHSPSPQLPIDDPTAQDLPSVAGVKLHISFAGSQWPSVHGPTETPRREDTRPPPWSHQSRVHWLSSLHTTPSQAFFSQAPSTQTPGALSQSQEHPPHWISRPELHALEHRLHTDHGRHQADLQLGTGPYSLMKSQGLAPASLVVSAGRERSRIVEVEDSESPYPKRVLTYWKSPQTPVSVPQPASSTA